jgi:hypothetical protein
MRRATRTLGARWQMTNLTCKMYIHRRHDAYMLMLGGRMVQPRRIHGCPSLALSTPSHEELKGCYLPAAGMPFEWFRGSRRQQPRRLAVGSEVWGPRGLVARGRTTACCTFMCFSGIFLLCSPLMPLTLHAPPVAVQAQLFNTFCCAGVPPVQVAFNIAQCFTSNDRYLSFDLGGLSWLAPLS